MGGWEWGQGESRVQGGAQGERVGAAAAKRLPRTGRVPHAHSLVQAGGHNELLLGVELRAHDVVVVPREHGHAGAGLPVPQADGLVVGRGH